MDLPKQYADLIPAAQKRSLLQVAMPLYGIAEFVGEASNPIILEWAHALGPQVKQRYTADSIPWCGIFMGFVAKSAGYTIPALPERAMEWKSWGADAGANPVFGDVLVFWREGGGHVGIYVGEDNDCYHVLGGNQDDAVSIKRIPREMFRYARRPLPTPAKRIWREKDGAVIQSMV